MPYNNSITNKHRFFKMTKTERLINRIKEVENFENVAWVCKNFQDFCFEVAEWGVDHAAGVDFDEMASCSSCLSSLGRQPGPFLGFLAQL